MTIVPAYRNQMDIEKPFLAFFTSKAVPKGAELCFDYNPAADDPDYEEEEVSFVWVLRTVCFGDLTLIYDTHLWYLSALLRLFRSRWTRYGGRACVGHLTAAVVSFESATHGAFVL